MNKTVNINIGGLFFNVDENAYQKLARYFDAIKRSLSNTSGQDEIMKDIEMRVAELLSERQKSDKHAINVSDVDAVVAVMGQPEDYRIDDEGETSNQSFSSSENRIKKLYLDTENNRLGGVCAGLGHYFGIDVSVIRIFFVILAFAGVGTGILAYFILWMAVTEAKTTSQKIEMKGEKVNISNIEKRVRQEFETVSSKIKNADYDELGNKVKNGAEKIGSNLGDVLTSIFKVFAKVLGVILIITSASTIIGVAITSIVMFFANTMPATSILKHVHTPIGLDTPLWIQGILFLIVFGIPFFFLLILGLKLLVANMKPISNNVKYGLLALWILGLGTMIYLGIKTASEYSFDGKSVKKEIINIKPTDTLFIKFKNNEEYSNVVNRSEDIDFVLDKDKKQVIYTNDIAFIIEKTDEPLPYIQINKIARGSSSIDANNKAEKIRYKYSIIGNKIVLDDYLLNDFNTRVHNQKVEIYLYLPKNTIFKVDENTEKFDNSENDFFNLHYSSASYIYKVGDYQVKCLNCPAYENEDYNDVLNESEMNFENMNDSENDEDGSKMLDSLNPSIEISDDGVLIKTKDGIKTKGEVKSLKIDKNEIQIKTK